MVSLLGAGVYSNALETPFIFDSYGHIVENASIRLTTLDLDELRRVALESKSRNRPVASISLALNYYFGEYEVFGYHVVNVGIHIVNGILVYLLALIAFRQAARLRDGAFLAPAFLLTATLFLTTVFFPAWGLLYLMVFASPSETSMPFSARAATISFDVAPGCSAR